MRRQLTMDEMMELRGAPIVDANGDKLGTLEHIYLDVRGNEPRWIALKTGLLGGRSTFVPVDGADVEGNAVRVAVAKEQVDASPDVVPDAISTHTEEALRAHYGQGSAVGGYEQPARPVQGEPETGYEQQDARARRWDWENRR